MTKSLFTTLLSLLKSTGTVSNFSMSNLSASGFKLAKSHFDVPTPIAFLNLLLSHNQTNPL